MKLALLTALTSLAAISCAGKAGEAVGPRDGGAGGAAVIACSDDAQCGNNGSCFAKRCVDRIDSLGTWAVELRAPGSPVTELPSVSGTPVVLRASAVLQLGVTLTSDSASGTTVPAAAGVILTVPSRIPGRPALSFQANLPATPTLEVSDDIRGEQATVNVIPLPPSDLTIPPYTFSVSIPTSGSTLDLPKLPGAPFKISGQLVDALNGGKGQFTARAFQAGLLVSTIATTSTIDPVGNFTLYLPAGNPTVTLELVPTSGAADPWMTLAQVSLSQAPKDLGPITLPTYAMANAFRVTVHGNDSLQTPVGNVAIRAFTTEFTGGDDRGATKFLRDGTTDAAGSAQLSLIPGDSLTARMYTLSVVPPPGSPWATQCVGGVPVLWNGSGTAIQDFTLAPRPVFSGTLLSVDGTPIANAVVTATRGPSAASACLPGPLTTSAITDAAGAFALALDPGDGYQIDYDPPTGSPAPRKTEYDISVADQIHRTIHLLRPVLFEGDVVDADQKPLAFTTIRIFEPRCATTDPCSMPPMLRGQTQSDKDGHFRAIVAAPAAN